MGWKLFSAVFAVITVLGVWNSHPSPADVFDGLMSTVAAVGLVLFAFKLPFLNRYFWQAFAFGYVAYSLFDAAIAGPGLYKQYASGGKSLSVLLGAFVVFGGLQLAVSLGLWSYATNFPPRRSIRV